MKRGWLGEKTGSGFYKRVKKGGESEILTLDWKKMEYRPRQKAKFASIEAGKHDRRYARAAAHASSGRSWRAKTATKRIAFFGAVFREMCSMPRGAFRKLRTASWMWTAPCTGDLPGNWGRLKFGIAIGVEPMARMLEREKGAAAACDFEVLSSEQKIVLRIAAGALRAILTLRGSVTSRCRSRTGDHSEIAEGTIESRAGKFRSQPDRSGRRRGCAANSTPR